MAISGQQVASSSTLETLRTQFNNLVTDVAGLEGGSISYTTLNTTTTNATTLNVKEDGTIVFEGATDDGFETTLTVVDPTADRTITFPNESGTVHTSGGTTTHTAIVVADGGNIGSASDTDAIAIAANGNITVNQNLSVGGNLDVTGTLDLSDSDFTNVGSIQLDSIAGDGDTNTSITFSGSDVITIATGGSTAATFNASQVTTLSGNLTLTGTPTGNFITHIDQYRIIGNFDTDNNPLGSGTPSNNTIERNDTTGAALLGTAMTNSSGIFSFPTTGLWRVETSVYYKADASTNDGGLKTDIQLTTDNSNFNTMARGSGNSHNTSLAAEDSVYVQVYLDITNTSTHKVKFTSDSTGNANTTIQGDTDISKTWFCFTRFGDT